MSTVLAACTANFLAYVEARGLPRQEMLTEAGLEEAMLADPNGRVPLAGEIALWRAAVRRLGEPALGLDYAAHRDVEAIRGITAIVARAAQTLEEALVAIAQYHRLLLDDGEATFAITDEGEGVLRWMPTHEAGRFAWPPELEDGLLGSCLRFVRAWIDGEDPLAPARVRLRRPKPDDTRPHEAFFACPVDFGTPVSEVAFAAETLRRRLCARHGDVAGYLTLAADALVTKLARTRSLREDVLAAFVMVGLEQAEVAGHFGCSVRTLQRRLLDEGLTYHALVDEHRRSLALVLSKDPALTATEVAARCGFSDVTAFRRALRRWKREMPTTAANRDAAAPRDDVSGVRARQDGGLGPGSS